jgi:2-polyprenyl-3-methyl-5-hydroxy-6-metoxy-1,4-benzoquinol methylase
MEEISCLFCQEQQHPVVIEENNFKGKKCSSCPLIYISPRPTAEQVCDLYGHGQAQVDAQIHIGGTTLKRLYARHTLRCIKPFINKGSLLELGAGAGYFLDEARCADFSVFGVELNPAQAAFIEQTFGIACEQKPLSLTTFGTQTFDVIYHSDVLSHFHDPVQVFRLMYQKLRPQGFVVFETGNIADIDERYYRSFAQFQYPDHLFFFGEESIRKLLHTTGFSMRHSYRYSIVPQLILTRFLQRDTLQKPIALSSAAAQKKGMIHRFAQKMYHHLLYATRYQLGSVMPTKNRPQTVIVIAQKY